MRGRLMILLMSIGYIVSAMESSNINVDIGIKKSKIENYINQEVEKSFEGAGTGENIFNSKVIDLGIDILGNLSDKINSYIKNLKWGFKIDRDNIKIGLNSNKIELKSELNGIFKVNWSEQGENAQLDIKGNLKFLSKFDILNDWSLKLETIPSFDILNKNLPLNLNFYGIKFTKNINIGENIEETLNTTLKKATERFDKKIIESVNLKTNVLNLINQLKNPLLLDEENSVWITVTPVSASYSEFLTDEENIRVGIGSKMGLSLAVGEPEKIIRDMKLPQITYGVIDKESDINLPVKLDYNKLKEIINRDEVNKTVDIFYGIKATFENIDISSNNKILDVNSDVNFKLLWFFNLKGKLKGKLTVVENQKDNNRFDYQLETDSSILRFVNKLIKTRLIKSIVENKYLNFNDKNNNSKIRDDIQNRLNKILEKKAPELNVKLKDIKLNRLNFEKESIKILFEIKSEFKLEL